MYYVCIHVLAPLDALRRVFNGFMCVCVFLFAFKLQRRANEKVGHASGTIPKTFETLLMTSFLI